MKRLFVPFFSCLTLSAYAQMNCANPNQLDYLEATVNDLKKQVADLKKQSGAKAINPPAGPNVQGGCDFFVTGDLLYWKASEEGVAYAAKAKLIDQTTVTPGNGEIQEPHFDTDLGFRVGLGWNTNHDAWDLYFSWTRLHTAAHGHTHAGSDYLLSFFADSFYGDRPALHASSHLKIHYNVLDLALGREFYVGKFLSLRPHFGLENIWISQHYHIKYDGLTPILNLPANTSAFNHVSFRNNFWGIGARAGLNTQWELRWGISIIGDIAWSLLYGNFDIKRTSRLNETFLQTVNAKPHIDHDMKQACTAMQWLLGLQWDYMFAHDRCHFGISAAWEQHVYFSQNQMFSLYTGELAGASRYTSPDGDLTFQGLTVSARFDF